MRYKKFGFTEKEIEDTLLETHRRILQNSDLPDIVDTILNFREMYCDFLDEEEIFVERKYYQTFKRNLAKRLSIYDFEYREGRLLDNNRILEKTSELLLSYEIIERLKPEAETPIANNLTISEIALLHIYLGKVVTKENASARIKPYGYSSGAKLYNTYTSFMKVANRRGLPEKCTPVIFKNRVALFEKVIDLLPEDKKKGAQADLEHLIKKYEE